MNVIIQNNQNNYNNQNNTNNINNQNYIYQNIPYYQNNPINQQQMQQYNEITSLNSNKKKYNLQYRISKSKYSI